MKCYICDKEEWYKPTVKEGETTVPVHSKSIILICKNCGNCCHEVEPQREEKVKQYYRKDYRPAPAITNLITTTHKLNYVRVFLKDFLQSRSKQVMKVADVGCATGYLLNFFKNLGHMVTGCEYTITYRRMCEHYYGIPTTEELEEKHRYDLITIYHVLEHMIEPDKKLAKYASLLADGGHLLISTPEWFDYLEENSGQKTADFDHLFHKDHINLFSKTSLTNLFRKCGLTVIKQNFGQYGQTYLLRKSGQSELPQDWMIKENFTDIERKLLSARKAIPLFMAGKWQDALDIEPNFPEAWLGMILQKAAKDPGRQAELFSQAEKATSGNKRIIIAKAQWLYQRGELRDALKYFGEYVEIRPNEDAYMYMGFCYAQLGESVKAIECFNVAQAMDPQKWRECQTWILKIVSEMPTWDEVGLAKAKELLFNSAMEKGDVKVEMKDALQGASGG